ncbi:MAG: hypothetical protein ABL890_02835 [Candidatus Peribacteraceae bacterium]
MKTLFLDLASHKKSISLVSDASADMRFLTDHTDEASLLPSIEQLLKDNGQTFETIEKLACVTGPGGFMSLRTGIALVNALQWRLGIPMAGIHLSDVWAARAGSVERLPAGQAGVAGSGWIWLHSTKKEAFFIRGFGSFEKIWKELELITLAELQEKITTPTPFVGELLDEQRAKLPHLQEMSDIRSLKDVLPTIIGSAKFEKKSIVPWYGRGA